ncbi:hypothetical protein QR680_001294 [Steinernema hermaphroditum]|uniref:RING-type domain-containing protein n=1 Tax=Steinernema hermaphroditum TaxID=289476 RepID=A0AA39GZ92_9BILA|nr:hypothetical protein QR680_001294 [Steinernema hermaphroditum]
MLADVIPISVKLEIVRGAPFVDISPSEGPSISEKVEQVPTVPVWNMPPKRRNKKSASRSETSAGAPLAPPVKMQHSGTDNVTLDKDACMGRRTYSEVVVETIKPTQQPSSSRKVMASCLAQPSRGSSEPAAVVEKIAYYCGNPTVEKTTGLLHFYKKSDNDVVLDEELNMLCMLAVPATITCQDLIDFVTPQMEKIMEMKIIRDSTPNQYMVLLKMRSHVDACSFFYEYNGRNFWEHDENVCSLVFVERVESISADDKGSLPFSSLTELPTCAVCLERMDDDVLTILCNHSFHARCLKQWTDYTCPVCRYLQTPEVTREQPCNDCDKTSDLWMCLICGNIGCGRYAEAHAYQHFLKTQHTYTLEVGGDKVWDYAGDNYVHRLIQVGSENKFAEIEHNACGREDGDKNVEKLQVEYACLMTNQLETQRHFFEEKMRQTEERLKAESKVIQSQIGSLSGELNEVREQNENLKKKVKELTHEKSAVEKKNNNVTTKLEKTQLELEEERVVTKVLRADIEKLHKKIEQLETSNAATKAACLQEMNEYQEQIRDLMAHFNAQVLLKDEITEAESAEASVTVGEAPKPAPTPTRRQRKHKK